MANEFTLPSLGEGIEAGDVLTVLIKAGDTVTKEQPVIELETDKATVEVPSAVDGTVDEVKVAEGDTITVGQVVFTFTANGASGGDVDDVGGETGGDTTPKADGVQAPAKADETQRAAAKAVNDQDEGLDGEAPAGEPAQTASTEAEAEAGGGERVEVTLPSLGEGVTSADVLSVLVKAGDTVEKDQGIIELETDKATVEVPAPSAGTVVEVKVKDGDSIAPGQVVLVLESSGGGAKPAAPERSAKAPAKAEADRGAGATEASRSAGASAPAKGTPSTAAPSAGAGTGAIAPPRPNVPAAPSVRRLARELGLDIADVKGNGPGGRISQADVMAHAKQVITTASTGGASSAAGAFAFEPLPDFSQFGDVERVKMKGIRRKTAEHMVASWHTIPHVTQCEKADITDLEALRKQFGPRVEKGGGKLTVTSIAVKVVATALRRFPNVNVSVDLPNEEIIQKQYVHIGLAVDTPRGLLVPVIRNADTKSITEISAEVGALAEKARAGKLSLDEMSGGCFTITNLGGIGGTYFTPIVNHPEVAILGMSRSAMEPVWKDDDFEPRLMLPLSMSYDHRVVDGADAMRFLKFVAESLEQPFLLSL